MDQARERAALREGPQCGVLCRSAGRCDVVQKRLHLQISDVAWRHAVGEVALKILLRADALLARPVRFPVVPVAGCPQPGEKGLEQVATQTCTLLRCDVTRGLGD